MGGKWRMPTAVMSNRDIFEYDSSNKAIHERAQLKITNLDDESLRAFARAQAENKSTNIVAHTIAEERLNE